MAFYASTLDNKFQREIKISLGNDVLFTPDYGNYSETHTQRIDYNFNAFSLVEGIVQIEALNIRNEACANLGFLIGKDLDFLNIKISCMVSYSGEKILYVNYTLFFPLETFTEMPVYKSLNYVFLIKELNFDTYQTQFDANENLYLNTALLGSVNDIAYYSNSYIRFPRLPVDYETKIITKNGLDYIVFYILCLEGVVSNSIPAGFGEGGITGIQNYNDFNSIVSALRPTDIKCCIAECFGITE